MARLFSVLLLILTIFGNALPQDLSDIHRKTLASAEARDYKAAITELQDLRSSNPEAFAANNYDYLLARMAESDGQLGLAMVNYQAVANRDSILKAYALMRMSRIARSTGNLALENIYLREIVLVSPHSLPASQAAYRMARNSFERENYEETILILNGGVRRLPDSGKPATVAVSRENMVLLSEAYLAAGQTVRAHEIFTGLLQTIPNPSQPDDAALSAAKGLDLLDGGKENFGKSAPRLTETEHLRRANIYQSDRDFANARLHFEAVIATFPDAASAADAAFQIGRGFAQQSDFVEALKWFERVLEQYPDRAPAKDALLQAAAAYSRVGKSVVAINRYRDFIQKYPDDEKLDRAYLNIVDVYRDQGSETDALKWCAQTRKVFKGRLPETIAMFTEARIFIGRDDWQSAIDLLEKLSGFSDLGGEKVPGGTNAHEIAFMKAFALEQLKRYADAIDAYLSIPDGRGEYYGWRATERLKLLSNDETARSFIAQKTGALATGLAAKDPDTRKSNAMAILRLTNLSDLREKSLEVLKEAIKTLPRYQGVPDFQFRGPHPMAPRATPPPNPSIADALLFLGLYDEAAPHLEAAAGGSKVADNRAFALARYQKRGDRADRAVAFIEPIWRKMPADYPIELMPRDHLELLYPAPYADKLLEFSPARGVDPRLVLAIMRQESRFQPDAKSYAAARGLMQFISTTSTHVAGELGRDSFRQDDLYYPRTAILFGSQYLADLFAAFPNQPDAVAASYNGGADNMKRWLARSKSSLPERYVPEIVYSQSKDYVYKVMANYRMYRHLYDENLRPR